MYDDPESEFQCVTFFNEDCFEWRLRQTAGTANPEPPAAEPTPTATTPTAPRPPWMPKCVDWQGYPGSDEPNCCQKCAENVYEMTQSCNNKCGFFENFQCGLAMQNYSAECAAMCGCNQ